MHPKSPRQERQISWTDSAVVCFSSKYSRFALFAFGTLYFIVSLTFPNGKHIAPVGDADVKRLMQRQDEEEVQLTELPEDWDNSKPPNEAHYTNYFTSYLPMSHPVLNQTATDPQKNQPVNVRFLMGPKERSQSEFIVEGIERSSYLKLVSMTRYLNTSEIVSRFTNKIDSKHETVWMADVESMDMNCYILQGILQRLYQDCHEKVPTALVLMDYSGSSDRLHCPNIEEIIPRQRIRLAKSNIVVDRYWDLEQSWISVGQLAPNDGPSISGGNIMFAPHMVRDALVYGVKKAMQKQNRGTVASPVDLKRERDVAHFWTSNDYSHYSFLRDNVSSVVESLKGKSSNGRKIHTVVKTLGEEEEMQLGKINYEYIQQMIDIKIVVVAARDEWEGSYRLLEALASGAMVLADKTLALPSGLVDGESLVFYDSGQSLKDKIMYYLNPKNDKERLRIARKGWEVAMGRHRSWHRVEEIVFGEPLTQVDQPLESAPGKRKRRVQTEDTATY